MQPNDDKYTGRMLFALWTIICLIGTYFLIEVSTGAKTISPGTEFTTRPNDAYIISGKGSGIFASNTPFWMEDDSHRVITSTEKPKPFQWNYGRYFEASEQNLEGRWSMNYDKWIIGRVDAEIHLAKSPKYTDLWTIASITIGFCGWAGMIAFFIHAAKSK